MKHFQFYFSCLIILFQATDAAWNRSMSDADKSVVAAMRTVHWMAKEDIPIKKYSSLMEFQSLQGCEAITKLSVAQNATYTSRMAGEDFQTCVAEDIHQQLVNNIKNADMYSVLVDESTDLAICKQMIVYVRILDQSFVPCTYFLKNTTITEAKSDASVLFACIENTLEENGISFKKLRGFGSDGASVMVGRHRGVASKVKDKSPHCISIHCMAHRFNLATSQASKNIADLKDLEKNLSDLYYYFGGSKSGNRKCELEEIQKVLEEPVIKIKECHEIRWIAFFEAVSAVYKCWQSLITFFKNHDDSKARLFRKTLADYKFIAMISMLMDILPAVAQVSMMLQKQDVDIAVTNAALSNLKDRIKLAKKGNTHYQSELLAKLEKKKDKDGITKEVVYKGHKLDFGKRLKETSKEIDNVRMAFCDNLAKNIDDRFPKAELSVATSFSVLSMRPLSFLSKEEQESYGNKELQVLIDHYGEAAKSGDIISDPLIDKVKCQEEWSLAKKIVMEQRYPRDSTKILWKLLFDFHKDVLPNMIILSNLALIMPYQTADCERGFSCQNGIKTARRNRLKEKSLNVLMTIKCEGESVGEHNFKSAAYTWKTKKDRRLFKKN